MQCKTFHLRIREDRIEEYDEAHPHVWPELLVELQSFGVQTAPSFGEVKSCFFISGFRTSMSCFATSRA